MKEEDILASTADRTETSRFDSGTAAVLVNQDLTWHNLDSDFVIALSIRLEPQDNNPTDFSVRVRSRKSNSANTVIGRDLVDESHIIFSSKAITDVSPLLLSDTGALQCDFIVRDECLHSDVKYFLLCATDGKSRRIELGFRAMAIISALSRMAHTSVGETLLSRASRYIHANPFERCQPRHIAAQLAVDVSVLERAFAESEHHSLKGYIREARAVAAKLLVLRTSRPLAQIAFDAGFSSQAHMTTVFKARFGKTPGQLRKNSDPARS